MEKKKKKPFYKRWWFIGIVAIIVIGVIIPSEDKGSETSNKVSTGQSSSAVTKTDKADKLEKSKTTKYKAGTYKVGDDIPPGEYKIFCDGILGYYELTKDSSGSLESIITNDNFSTFTYLTIPEGKYLKLQSSYAIPVEEATPYELENEYGPGVYKVGYDIPAGEYNIQKEEGELYGYVEVSKDSKGTLDSIITNDNFENNKYITIKDGQYLKILYGYIE